MADIKSLILRVTEQCNLQCTYCYAAHGSNGTMSVETARQAISLCCPVGGSLRIQFTGGEPLLNLSLMEDVYYFGKATHRQLHLAVQTNGTLLTREVCRTLSRIQCAVGVSLDGLPESNRCRLFPDGTASFPAAVQGIQTLGAAGLRCNLTTVVTRANAAHLGQLPDLALWLGNVSGVGLDLFRPLGRGTDEPLSPHENDLTQGLSELLQKAGALRSTGIPFRLREWERLKKKIACGGCGDLYCYAQSDASLCVDSRGDCWPCSSLAGNRRYLLGNLRDGLPSIPRSSYTLTAPPDCLRCASFPYCGGGCPAGRAAQPQERNPLTCVMHHLLEHEMGGML